MFNIITLSPIQQSVTSLQSILSNMERQMIDNATAAFNLIWYNQDQVNCSPDKMIAGLGVSASMLINANNSLQALINSASPGSINLQIPAGWALTVNQDGSAIASYTQPSS